MLVDLMRQFGHQEVHYAPDIARARGILDETLCEGDLLITLGAGDVWKVGEQFLQ
jgi:UDP-N-acetylmuramate--alanine ligase